MRTMQKKGISEIGKYKYPLTITPASALEIAQKALNTYHTQSFLTIALAKISGHKVNENKGTVSGAFRRKLEGMHLSGIFTEEKRGTQQITASALNALDPTNPEKAKKARGQLYMSKIPLLYEIFKKCGAKIPQNEEFLALLTQITDASWPEAKKHLKKIRNLYLEAREYLSSAETPELELALKSDKGVIGGREIKMPTNRNIWDTIIDATIMRWGPEKEARTAFKRLTERTNQLNLETTKLMIETLKDFIGDNGNKEEIRKGSERILTALEADLNVEKPKSKEGKESGSQENQ